MKMKFEFTAQVTALGYSTNAEVEKQAMAHLSEPDMTILTLTIGTWSKYRDGWEANVEACVDDGRDSSAGDFGTQHAVIWPNHE